MYRDNRFRPLRPARALLLLLLPPLTTVLLASPVAGQADAQPGLTLQDVVRATLAASSEIGAAAAVVRAEEGVVREARGSFDPVVQGTTAALRAVSPAATEGVSAGALDRMTQEMTYTLAVEQRLRSGIIVAPRVAVQRSEGVGEGALPRSITTAGLDLMVPFGRGRGGGMFTAHERVAAHGQAAAEDEFRHTRQMALLSAVQAYWGYVAAHQRLKVLHEAEARAGRLLAETHRLIVADARPAADSVRVAANRASKRSSRLAGEQSLTDARTRLALAMGISPAAARELPAPMDELPAATPATLVGGAEGAVARALESRTDLAAARSRQIAAEQILSASWRETRPRLDLNVRLGYSHAVEGGPAGPMPSVWSAGQQGLTAEMVVTTAVPLGNRAARGIVEQRAAARDQAAVAAAEVARGIALRAAAAAETLERAGEELAEADEAVRLHAAEVENESERFRRGSATLFDVINAGDGLTAATLARTEGYLRYAVSAAQLDFETGNLIEEAVRHRDVP